MSGQVGARMQWTTSTVGYIRRNRVMWCAAVAIVLSCAVIKNGWSSYLPYLLQARKQDCLGRLQMKYSWRLPHSDDSTVVRYCHCRCWSWRQHQSPHALISFVCDAFEGGNEIIKVSVAEKLLQLKIYASLFFFYLEIHGMKKKDWFEPKFSASATELGKFTLAVSGKRRQMRPPSTDSEPKTI